MRQLLGLAVAAAMLASAVPCGAAEFTFDHSTVTLRGPIVAGDGAQLDAFLSAGHNNGHPLTTLVLISPGGLVAEGIALADAVRAYRVDTVVPQDAECASACFLPFAAGTHMKVGQGARVGIHSATSTGGRGDDDGHATLVMARYAAQLGVPPAIVGRMVETDSINITWLDDADLRAMGAEVPESAARQSVGARAPAKAAGPFGQLASQGKADKAATISSTTVAFAPLASEFDRRNNARFLQMQAIMGVPATGAATQAPSH